MEDLDAASLEDVHAFFRRFYGPDNTVLTLCGDITAEHGFALAERYLGPLPAERRAAAPRPPAARAARRRRCALERREAVPNDRLHVAFRLPVDGTDEFLAAAVALDCVGGLSTSRLVRRLVRREQSALGAHATAWGFVDGGSLGFVVLDVAPGVEAGVVEDAFLEELAGFLEHGPTDAELEASLAQSERSWLSALASQEERADVISHHHLLHDDPEVVNTHLDRLTALTRDDVVAAARRWLRPESRAVVAYLTEDDADDDLTSPADVDADAEAVA